MPTDRIEISLEDEASDESRVENLLPGDESVEPGDPAVENVMFVLLGITLALVVVARLVMLYG